MEPKNQNPILTFLSRALFVLAAAGLFLLAGAVILGLPLPDWFPLFDNLKSVRKIFQVAVALFGSAALVSPRRKEILDGFFRRLTRFSEGWYGITALISIFSILFAWNQYSAYLSIDINFLPFSFYDYMLYYFSLGKVNFTGLLHGFYHVNNILYILAPIWFIFKSPLVLVFAHGVILALAALPLFLLTRRLFRGTWIPIVVAFFYLNFRYLLNLLEMDFLVESFYPLLIFTAVYFLFRKNLVLFAISVFATLLVKEDAPFYMLGLGIFLLFFRERRVYGLTAAILAIAYGIFLLKVFLPLTGSDILVGSAKNYGDVTKGPAEILGGALRNPLVYFKNMFWPAEKLKTYFKLLRQTLFLPLFSPWILTVLLALFPVFAQLHDKHAHFAGLRFHYSAVVIPFLFVALVTGLRNFASFLDRFKTKENILRILLFLLILINGGHYLSHSYTGFKTETIAKVREIPERGVLVTHGHLLPYAGYRTFNFYLAPPFEREEHPHHGIYSHADYYFLSRVVNPYPYNEAWVREKIEMLRKNPDVEIIYDDGEDVLFKRIKTPYRFDVKMLPVNFVPARIKERNIK